jgi:5-methylcytosine-specific restriction endonuclease McrA
VGEAYASLPRATYAEARERYDARWRHAWEQRWEAQRQQREQERREERAAWFAKYDEYLRSPRWRSLRAKVLRRAGGVCESCLERRATQVHHKTYERVFTEAAFDLVAICDACHARLHPREEETAA